MKKIILISLFLCACVDMQATRKPENQTNYTIHKKYDVVYRTIVKSLLNDCNIPPTNIQPTIFPDTKTATINYGMDGVVGWTMDIESINENESKIIFYSIFAAQVNNMKNAQKHFDLDLKSCIFNNIDQ